MKKRLTLLLLGTLTLAALIGGCGSSGVTASGSAQRPDQTEVYPQTVAKDQTESQTQALDESDALQTTDTQTSQMQSLEKTAITELDAKKIALDRAGIEEKDAISLVVKQDYDDGRSLYEVKIYTSDKDYEYKISKDDGSIYDEDIEMADRMTTVMAETPVTVDDVTATILEKVPGATEDHLRLKMDYDDGKYIYEGEVIYDNYEYEFEIDAQTGNIYEWKQESLMN